MNKIIMLCIFCVLVINAHSQMLEDKNNLYLGYQNGFYLGDALFNNQGTSAPSFYSNFTLNNGLEVKNLYNLTPLVSAGLKFGFLNSTNWQCRNYESYNGSKSSTINLQPVIQLHTKFQKNGLYNRVKIFGEISPIIGYSMLKIRNNIFDIIGYKWNYDNFNRTDLIYGLEVGVGCEYSFSNKIGAFVNISRQECFVSTPLFLDNRYTFLGLNIGVRLNISKVKRFKY
ncbi:MAG: hypothetical protein PHV20_02510 [Bacteroidales bacterium]|nr:hypothetical protein [Bacteroidales bacterium]